MHRKNLSKSPNYIQILDEDVESQIKLINELLTLQRFESGQESVELTTIQLKDWIQDVAEPFVFQALSRQQSLKIEISPNLRTLACDPTILKSVLAELLNNACNYTPPEEKITLKVSAESGTIQLKVCNSGVEIPQEELPRIFDKFYRVPGVNPWQQGGTGLGLSLVKKRVALLGGTIWVTSAAKETCFTVELPLVDSYYGR